MVTLTIDCPLHTPTHLADEADLATRCSSGEAVDEDGEDVMEAAAPA